MQKVYLAIAIIGGLITSTLLSLLVVPAIYDLINNELLWAMGDRHNPAPFE